MAERRQTNEEIEIKLDLGSFTNYLKLVGFLGQLDGEERQVNAFFDTEDRVLSRDGWALRVRVDEQRGSLAIKSRETAGEEASIRMEMESEIPRGEALEALALQRDIMGMDTPTIQFVRDQFGSLALVRFVHFENTRQYKAFRFGDYSYRLEIDTTRYADGSVDYELEVELPDRTHVPTVIDRLRKLFLSLDIPFLRQNRSKLARALERAPRA
ncbi:MAG TPA: CYTH domain-containing protein [candidate division Zixibacteria bacterium]|nr:CYTH domain-containing protein [candidate division Zixibacteria bacterium]MDD4916745.1 CYTH domain-containing protein [candidate division Zixibacteria bacterium]MDM7973814.1 CYTH domain-containing protein [candidate division Zixibacteria bacterium]HOD65359.1 CYTH domain-containing protein [candidate division Zixibacteria bacterium]HPC11290.1 CYTH domain-containing protein [candidate division Zixibacteria bacterium]